MDDGNNFPLLVHQQGSTVDEVHRKSFNAMNLDDLVKNVISVDHRHHHRLNHHHRNKSSSSSNSTSSSPSVFNANNNNNNDINNNSSNNNSDQVWKEIVEQQGNVNVTNERSSSVVVHQQEMMLGETTLEDFLVRAGVLGGGGGNQDRTVVSPRPLMEIDPMVMVKQQADWLQCQIGSNKNHMDRFHQHQSQQCASMPLQAVVDSNFQVSEVGFENSRMEVGFSENNNNQMTMGIPASVAPPSDYSTVGKERNNKMRFSDEIMEKTMERRQRRMIKNRESAARSRARKQAYTNRLEHQVFELRKTNNWLKKQKEMERLLQSNMQSTARYQLRRTSSAAF